MEKICKTKRKYGIGLDIGIGSVGFAVISRLNGNSDARIEDLGVRLFESGEDPQTKDSLSQSRRLYRGSRRLIRRRYHRKERVKAFLQKINLINKDTLQIWQEENGNQNVLATRLKGLTVRLTQGELADCIIHICNHRGYRDFYEDEAETKEAKKELGKIKKGLDYFEEIYQKGDYQSVADMLLNDKLFKAKNNSLFSDYHNHKDDERYVLIKREYLKEELENILRKQQEFYPQLTDRNIDFLCNDIVFAQRDFEDGPGDKNDRKRKFMGFLDNLGKCIFYKDEPRAFRSSVIADIYALINNLSQMAFVNSKTGEIELPRETVAEIIDTALNNAEFTEKQLKVILKKNNLYIVKPTKLEESIPNTIKTLKILKTVLEDSGYNYADLIKEEQFDLENPSKLHQLCMILAKNITPKRRIKALQQAGWNKKLQDEIRMKKFGKTANVCEKYMIEAIEAFKNGETYGNFQARRFKEQDKERENQSKKYKLLPPITKKDDEDIVKNIVVFKAINETRKVINALIRKYGSPEYINVEVASDLGRCKAERDRLKKLGIDNNKEYEKIKKELIDLNLRKEGEIRTSDIWRYKLWKMQDGCDLYTGKKIEIENILSSDYDIDHIVPFSLILDDTLKNKVLTASGINRQRKGQRVPLQMMSTEEERNEFIKRVNQLFKKKKINKDKYKYLILGNLLNTDLLSEWKSRNINDTRYISRYIVNYLKDNLQFIEIDKEDDKKKKRVYGIKGAITSRMRKMWLNKKTWGSKDKNRENNLHHAADAVVIANLTPAYVEIASDNIRLQQLNKSINQKNAVMIRDEYNAYLNKSVSKMQKYYGFAPEYTRKLLTSNDKIPSLVPNIRMEVDFRLNDDITDEEFTKRMGSLYARDLIFARSIQKPLVSYKINKKFQGQLTADNPVGPKKRKDAFIIKKDSLGNDNILNANSYYCVEIYTTKDEKKAVRGIRYVDLSKKGKKLYLNIPKPEDYGEHVIYLFKNDYIKIYDKDHKLKIEGFYTSVKNINRNSIYIKHNNLSDREIKSIGKNDIIQKFVVDILGKIGGQIKCSERFI